MVDIKVLESVVAELLNKKFEEEEYSDCFMVDIKVSGSRKIQVFIDRDSPVDFTLCRDISRYLESHLDENRGIPENYMLEVSSPGLTRPLTLLRQYHKHIGKKLKLKKLDGTTVKGVLSSLEDGVLSIRVSTKIGRKKVDEQVEVPFAVIESAKVIITF